jgi:hypothetical protein
MLRLAFITMVIVGILGIAHGKTEAIMPSTTLHEWLSWGEFDSVVTALEPTLQTGDSNLLDRAQLWVWLGVAYHGLHQPQAGDQAFLKAIATDTSVIWESALASPEMTMHFQELLVAEKKRQRLTTPNEAGHSEELLLITPVKLKPLTLPINREKSIQSDPSIGRSQTFVWGVAGTTVFLASGVFTWWYLRGDITTHEHVTTIGIGSKTE